MVKALWLSLSGSEFSYYYSGVRSAGPRLGWELALQCFLFPGGISGVYWGVLAVVLFGYILLWGFCYVLDVLYTI